MSNNKKLINKCSRKQKLASHKMSKDFNIKCTETPTQNIAICNAGLVTGMSRETVEELVDKIVISSNYKIIMPVLKSYSFIKFSKIDEAENFYSQYHGVAKIKSDNTPLYLSFVESVPDSENINNENLPPGLSLITDFVTEEEADKLMNIIDWETEGDDTSELKHRKAKHFGYIFRYDNNKVDLQNQISPIPEECSFLLIRFNEKNCASYLYDQLTVNKYLPGQGIPPHIDTHSIFEDTILSLSLGSDCVMDFKKDAEKVSILLPQRSLLIMKDEARYAWSHGIGPRHSDIVNVNGASTFQERGTRVSFTFRKVRSGNCCCRYLEHCDTKSSSLNNPLLLENRYVHEVYEHISSHFSETRHKQWPNVKQFINDLPAASILLDVGCGNGKYLQGKPDIYKVGCDRSFGLIEISRQRGFEVLTADCLKLPYKDNFADAAISIAVIHHLSTYERRQEAIRELVRVLKPSGKLLIYVWAKSQKKDSLPSAYLKYTSDRKSTKVLESKVEEKSETLLPVHQSGTEFVHDDVFVPWKRKGGGEFLRYYHVFEENELEILCSEIDNVNVEKVYYEQGNWCIVLNKKIK